MIAYILPDSFRSNSASSSRNEDLHFISRNFDARFSEFAVIDSTRFVEPINLKLISRLAAKWSVISRPMAMSSSSGVFDGFDTRLSATPSPALGTLRVKTS